MINNSKPLAAGLSSSTQSGPATFPSARLLTPMSFLHGVPSTAIPKMSINPTAMLPSLPANTITLPSLPTAFGPARKQNSPDNGHTTQAPQQSIILLPSSASIPFVATTTTQGSAQQATNPQPSSNSGVFVADESPNYWKELTELMNASEEDQHGYGQGSSSSSNVKTISRQQQQPAQQYVNQIPAYPNPPPVPQPKSIPSQHLTREEETYIRNLTCDELREKLLAYQEQRNMKRKDFLNLLGVSCRSYRTFMALSGPDANRKSRTYFAGLRLLKALKQSEKDVERERIQQLIVQQELAKQQQQQQRSQQLLNPIIQQHPQQLPPQQQQQIQAQGQPSSSSSSNPQQGKKTPKFRITSEPSPTQQQASVPKMISPQKEHKLKPDPHEHLSKEGKYFDPPVYDDCDEVRNKIKALTRESGKMTVKDFAQEIGVVARSVHHFLARTGPMEGVRSIVYRNAYYYFENLRNNAHEEKSAKRIMNEMTYPKGFSYAPMIL